MSNESFLERYVGDDLTSADHSFLSRHGHAAPREDHLFYISHLQRIAERHASAGPLDYVILVPTLRCNLACTYCQVSRVAEGARGFDWSADTLSAVIRYLDSLEGDRIKVEFQGGEPLLRLDLVEAVCDFCEGRFQHAEYVVCTNLQRLGPRERDFLGRPNVFVSTSLDGDRLTHQHNRTRSPDLTTSFFANLEDAIKLFGQDKISALPTIDYANPPDTEALLNMFANFGFRSVFLRPVNYHGFARRSYGHLKDAADQWNAYYFSVIDAIIERNYGAEAAFFEEYYFTLCLHRVLRAGHDGHVDLRSPACFGRDYFVIDYDGTLYPTDEARMVTRIGHINLSIGDVHAGVDDKKLAQLNQVAVNHFNEDCIHCPYQPYCGVDIVDDLSRYDRVDVRKLETWFCKRHMALFDRIFSYIYSPDPKIQYSLLRWAGLPRDQIELGLRHYDTALV